MAVFATAVSLIAPPAAHAEACNPEGTMCLVTETSPQVPLALPGSFVIRSPGLPRVTWRQSGTPTEPESGATSLAVTQIDGLPPPVFEGGVLTKEMHTWAASLAPLAGPNNFPSSIPVDGQITLHVEYAPTSNPVFDEEEYVGSDFAAWVSAPATGMATHFNRNGRNYVAGLSFTGRVPLSARLEGWFVAKTRHRCHRPRPCNSHRSVPALRLNATTAGVLPPGSHDLTTQVPIRSVGRACRWRLPCQFVLQGYVIPEFSPAALGVIQQIFNVRLPGRHHQPG